MRDVRPLVHALLGPPTLVVLALVSTRDCAETLVARRERPQPRPPRTLLEAVLAEPAVGDPLDGYWATFYLRTREQRLGALVHVLSADPEKYRRAQLVTLATWIAKRCCAADLAGTTPHLWDAHVRWLAADGAYRLLARLLLKLGVPVTQAALPRKAECWTVDARQCRQLLRVVLAERAGDVGLALRLALTLPRT